jgi:hypothetical protein
VSLDFSSRVMLFCLNGVTHRCFRGTSGWPNRSCRPFDQVDKSLQRMPVTVDGKHLYDWPVSTGGGGYDTPSGSFKPFRMKIHHRSDEWDDAPMQAEGL